MIFVEYPAGLVQVKLFFARLSPWQLEDVFKIGSDDMIVGRRLRQRLHPFQFAVGFLADIIRKIGRLEPFAKLFGLGLFAAVAILAKFLLDRLHLLTENVIALRFVHLGLRFGRDL